MRSILRGSFGASPPPPFSNPCLVNDHIILHHFVRTATSPCASSSSSPLSVLSLSKSTSAPCPPYSHPGDALDTIPFWQMSFTNPIISISNPFFLRKNFSLRITPFSAQGSPRFGALRRGGTLTSESTNFRRQGFERRAGESNFEGDNAKHMRDLESLEGAGREYRYSLQKLQGLDESAVELELGNAVEVRTKKSADARLSQKKVSLRSSNDEENSDEQRVASSAANVKGVSQEHKRNLRREPNVRENAKYLLDVLAIRNQGRQTGPAEKSTYMEEEIRVFEEWASMKLKEEGSSVEPVIEEMRISLLQRLTEASQPHLAEAGSYLSGSQTELQNARSKSLKLPTEMDPLAGISVRPIVVKRRTKVPENWDGPGGTVVLIDKPQGWSSFAVCGKLRHMLGVKKVGHAGTLDPLSTGLLIVCVGKATKLADSYQAMTKVYSGTMRLGETTPSLDAGTPVSEKLPWEHIQERDMLSAIDSFLGDIMQVPPMYSAIKVKGERLYTKARRGEEIVVPPRPVTIYDFQLKRSSQNRQDWDFRIICSKGTYIRSLCADLAQSLNSCAYLTALRREKIGDLNVKDAWPIADLETHYREVLKVPFQPYKNL